MYRAPKSSLQALLKYAVDFDEVSQTDAYRDVSDELAGDILEGAAKFAEDVLAPINRNGDLTPAKIDDGVVTTSPGFKEAYTAWVEAGWQGLTGPAHLGGMDMPQSLAVAVGEMMYSANMAFGLSPMLTHSAIEALHAHGSQELQELYLPKMMSGEWSGTMNLTEPQAGSDLGVLRSRAEPNADGTYAIFGQKIYITWGEHDCSENIIHLVLARLPDAPAGSKGISLFLAPKYLPDADGAPGKRNALKAIGLEHKLGIHGSPTCVMEFDGATAWLVGQPNRGLAHMFTMMNSARLFVGVQGVAIAERAYQQALSYAQDRTQGKAPGWDGGGSSPIIHHPDVRRTLAEMKARIMAARAICLATGKASDMAAAATDPEAKTAGAVREALLTPIAKAWSTDMGVEVTSLGLQLHGGMGYVEETGAAQHYRDARIAPIYEGTNAIQAIDLIGRKLRRDGGQGMASLIDEMSAGAQNAPDMIKSYLENGIAALQQATEWLLSGVSEEDALTGATRYLKLAGDVLGGHLLTKAAMQAKAMNDPSAGNLLSLAEIYARSILSPISSDISGIALGHDRIEAVALGDMVRI